MKPRTGCPCQTVEGDLRRKITFWHREVPLRMLRRDLGVALAEVELRLRKVMEVVDLVLELPGLVEGRDLLEDL